jgi:DNA-binding response OmpR family regulator
MGTTTDDQTHTPIASGGRPAVLIVDDEPSIREFLAFVLEDEGFDVATAADGHEALQTAKARPPDIVLTDLMMPVVDGYELISGLRREGVPVRAIIAMSAVQSGGRCIPADLFVAKPFQVEQVVASVRALLRRN